MAWNAQGGHSPLLAHVQYALALSPAEAVALRSLEAQSEARPRGTTLDVEGEPYSVGYIVKTGWAIRHKDLSDGRRQVLDFVLPGDIVGIEGCILRTADHSVTALTDLTVSPFPFARIEELIHEQPRLVTALVWYGARQRAVFAEHLMSLGRRSAQERLAHLLVEAWRRLDIRGLTDDVSFRMPVTQAVLADVMGLSVVHVNRSLGQLSSDGLVRKERETVTILDLDGLIEAAGFEGGYLNDAPMPERMLEALDRLRILRRGPDTESGRTP